MDYVWFTLGFFVIHLIAYVIAGVTNQQLVSKEIYGGEEPVFAPFFRDLEEPDERRRQGRLMIPAQLARAILMAVVLYPLLPAIADLSFGMRFAFLSGLMFVYADLAAATPFANNIEGLVYLKAQFTTREVFWRIQAEAIVYSLIFGVSAAGLLF